MSDVTMNKGLGPPEVLIRTTSAWPRRLPRPALAAAAATPHGRVEKTKDRVSEKGGGGRGRLATL